MPACGLGAGPDLPSTVSDPAVTLCPAPTLQTCKISRCQVGGRVGSWRIGSGLGVGSSFPKPEVLLTVTKDVGFEEGVVPLDLLERLGAEPKGLGG